MNQQRDNISVIKAIIRRMVPKKIWKMRKILQCTQPLAERICPICGYQGFFDNFGRPPRIDVLCPSCHSLERHRLFWLWFRAHENELRVPILHFAAEAIFEKLFRERYHGVKYQTADLFNQADLNINIENINLPDNSQNTVICNRVLEHVDDRMALKEIYRILAHKGVFIVSVPIIEGWDKTYENSAIITDEQRHLHFGQFDHVRYYGKDFRDRLKDAGFDYEEITATGEDVVKFGLLRGEKFFICTKSNA